MRFASGIGSGVGNPAETDTLGDWTGTTENFTKKTTSPPSGSTGFDEDGGVGSATDHPPSSTHRPARAGVRPDTAAGGPLLLPAMTGASYQWR
ncbi:hypothetical protein ACIGXM_28390 [Kitasatospora sp. NPDC052896]|uniref:hypothetical protein n=1 Tax=Kitasatospora sp. NPDC052896 TaxID=3364061 RepID=UPI0037C9E068